MFDTIYDDARRRVCAVAAELTPGQLDSAVPATPDWTARQLLAHLTGVAADNVSGRTEGAPGPAWTERHVTERAERALPDVLAEWAAVAPAVCEAIAARTIPLPIVFDALTHEADLREAFGLGRLPAEVVDSVLDVLVGPVVRAAAVDGALVVRSGAREWSAGEGARTSVTVDPYELFRGLISRRSGPQMRGWDWSGDVERYVDALPRFGPRADDQPVP